MDYNTPGPSPYGHRSPRLPVPSRPHGPRAPPSPTRQNGPQGPPPIRPPPAPRMPYGPLTASPWTPNSSSSRSPSPSSSRRSPDSPTLPPGTLTPSGSLTPTLTQRPPNSRLPASPDPRFPLPPYGRKSPQPPRLQIPGQNDQLSVPTQRYPPGRNNVIPPSWCTSKSAESAIDIIGEYMDNDDESDTSSKASSTVHRGIANSPVWSNDSRSRSRTRDVIPSVDSFSLAMAGVGISAPRGQQQQQSRRVDSPLSNQPPTARPDFQQQQQQKPFPWREPPPQEDQISRDTVPPLGTAPSTTNGGRLAVSRLNARNSTRNANAGTSMTSLRDLIDRASRLASNLDRGQTSPSDRGNFSDTGKCSTLLFF